MILWGGGGTGFHRVQVVNGNMTHHSCTSPGLQNKAEQLRGRVTAFTWWMREPPQRTEEKRATWSDSGVTELEPVSDLPVAPL